MMASYSFGIEEEYFVVDRRTGGIKTDLSKPFMAKASRELGPQLMNELLQSQIEVATKPFTSIDDARRELMAFRAILSGIGREFGLGIMAAGTHPMARPEQHRATDKPRYAEVISELGIVGLGVAVCGLHVHVELPEIESRIDVMNRMIPFLPLLLALSTSSPFWSGIETGLLGYRSAATDASPRSGLPEAFSSNSEYEEYVGALIRAGALPDASHIWWFLRPSMQHPTLELRIMDCCTAVDDSLAIAGLYRGLVRHLVRNRAVNGNLSSLTRALTGENRWRAQRYGVDGTFIDIWTKEPKPVAQVLEETMEMVKNDLLELGHQTAVRHLREIVRNGTSAHRQLELYRSLQTAGMTQIEALTQVSRWLMASTQEGDFIGSNDTSVAA